MPDFRLWKYGMKGPTNKHSVRKGGMRVLRILQWYKLMKARLKYRNSERDLTDAYLLKQLYEELNELQSAYDKRDFCSEHGVIYEIADVINTAEIMYRNWWFSLPPGLRNDFEQRVKKVSPY